MARGNRNSPVPRCFRDLYQANALARVAKPPVDRSGDADGCLTLRESATRVSLRPLGRVLEGPTTPNCLLRASFRALQA